MVKPISFQFAILVHLLKWDSESTCYKLDDRVSICQTEGSNVESLYRELCNRDKIDQGEPYTFPSYILITDSTFDSVYYWNSASSTISKCANLITVCLSNALGMCRLIISSDNFLTDISPSIIIYEDYEELQSLRGRDVHEFGLLNDTNLYEIKTCWQNYQRICNSDKLNRHRVENALSYFFYAWRSHNLEHICINLSIVLETLFSPSSAIELSHQIAFNLSRFLGENREQRESLFITIKKFYSLRSKIVHGGQANNDDLYTNVPDVFHICARVLKNILTDIKLAQIFCNDQNRQNLFKEWLFT